MFNPADPYYTGAFVDPVAWIISFGLLVFAGWLIFKGDS